MTAPSNEAVIALAARIERDMTRIGADVARLRAMVAGRSDDLATELHGPVGQAREEFISSGAAARRFGVSDDTIRRRAASESVTTTGSGRCVRYSTRDLQEVFRAK